MIIQIILILFNIVTLPISILVFTFHVLTGIKFVKFNDERIGHFGFNLEACIRKNNDDVDKNYLIGLCSLNTSNMKLLGMYRRIIPIIRLPKILLDVIHLYYTKSVILVILENYEKISLDCRTEEEMKLPSSGIKLNLEEEMVGEVLCDSMRLKGEFVCFLARDNSYLGEGYEYHDYRDVDINTLVPAMKYAVDKGMSSLRMGAKQVKFESHDKNIIDYAGKYRTELGDIYLCANCKFYVGDTSGLIAIPELFGIPVIQINTIPSFHVPRLQNGLYIPKKMWWKSRHRLLNFEEMLSYNIQRTEDYEKLGIEIINNTSEEILEVVKEMNERLDGNFKITEQDERLQERYKELYKRVTGYNLECRIGKTFLRSNESLLITS